MTVHADIEQPLREGLVRLLPTSAELVRHRGLALSPRDTAILAAIATHGALSAELVDLAFFRGAAVRPAADSRANRRLRQLWLAGLLERLELPISRRRGGSRPFVSALTAQGAAFAAASGRAATVPVLRVDRRAACFGEHDRCAATLWAHMQALTRLGQVRACRWVPEAEWRARQQRVRDPATGQSLPVQPDDYAELEYANGTVQCCLVEIDMGTLELWRFRRKLRAFELYLAQGGFTRDYGRRGFEALVLAPSEKRLEHRWRAGRQVVPETAWRWYSFALVDILASRERFAGKVWRTLRGDQTGLLYDRPQPAGQGERSSERRP